MLKKMVLVGFLSCTSLFAYPGNGGERRSDFTKFVASALGNELENLSDKNSADDVELLNIYDNDLLETNGDERSEANGNSQQNNICCGAARCNPWEIVHYLLARGAQVHPCEYMHSAATYGCNRTLIAFGLIDVNVQNEYEQTALVTEAGNSDIAIALCNAAWAEANAVERNGRTALIVASENGDIEKVYALIATQEQIDVVDHMGWTALMSAAFNDHAEIVELLLAAKAHPDIVTRQLGWTALMHAATRDDIAMVKILIGAGAGINNVDRNGETALILAARRGHVATVELLLAAEAPPYIINKDGETALLLVARKWRFGPMARMIIDEYCRRLLSPCYVVGRLILRDSQALIEKMLPVECGQEMASLLSGQDILALRLVSIHCLVYAQREFEKIRRERMAKLKENLIEDIKFAKRGAGESLKIEKLLARELARTEGFSVVTALAAHVQQPINVEIARELSEDSGVGVG